MTRQEAFNSTRSYYFRERIAAHQHSIWPEIDMSVLRCYWNIASANAAKYAFNVRTSILCGYNDAAP